MSAADVVHALGWTLVHASWQGALAAALAAVALWCLRTATPQARYAALAVALASCVLLPLATFAWLLLDTAPGSAPPADPSGVSIAMGAAMSVASVRDVSTSSSEYASLQAMLPALVACWATGAALFALRMAFGLGWVSRLSSGRGARFDAAWQARLDAMRVRMGVVRAVALRVVDGLDGPVAARAWRPVVLVPASVLARMPVDLLEALLAHELAHVKRHDYLVNLLQAAVEALLFFHPAAWWLSHQLRVEREHIADDLAAGAIGDGRTLARALDALAALRTDPASHPAGVPASTLAPAAAGGDLVNRIHRLVRPGRAAPSRALAVAVFGLSAACLAALAQADVAAPDRDDARVQAQAQADAASAAAVRATRDAHAAGSAADAARDRARTAARGVEADARSVARDAAEAGAAARSAARDAQRAEAQARHAASDIRLMHGDGDGRTQYALVDADGVRSIGAYVSQPDFDALRSRYDGAFVWVKRDGRAWVIRDPATVARIRDAWKPTEPLSREMEALGARMEAEGRKLEALGARMEESSRAAEPQQREMERLGREMDAVGRRMEPLALAMAGARDDAARERLGRQMAAVQAEMDALSSRMEAEADRMSRAHAPMEALGRQMEAASKPLEALGRQMDPLGKRMEALSESANRDALAAIDAALTSGRAEDAATQRR